MKLPIIFRIQPCGYPLFNDAERTRRISVFLRLLFGKAPQIVLALDIEMNVREAYVSAGAGFIVVLTGSVMTMPGLSKSPAAYNIDVNDDGVITGLF